MYQFDESIAEERRSPVPLRLTVVVVSFAVVVCVLLWFVWRVRAQEHSQVPVIAGSLIAFIGTILAVIVSYFAAHHSILEQRRFKHLQDRLDHTFDLHRDFSSESMLTSRAQADKLQQNNPTKSMENLYDELPPADTVCFAIVIDFYERLSVSVQHKRVDPEITVALFGSIFVWWWVNALEEEVCNAHSDWSSAAHLKKLYKFFSDESGAEDWDFWNKRAHKDRLKRLGR